MQDHSKQNSGLRVSAGDLYVGKTSAVLRFVLCPSIRLYLLVLRGRCELHVAGQDVESEDLISAKTFG